MKNFIIFFSYMMLFVLAMLLSIAAYFAALEYFWSGFEWTPFGYETCGLEGLVWPLAILQLLVLSLVF